MPDTSIIIDATMHLKLLVCELHGAAIMPNETSLVRHLRGQGHHRRGHTLQSIRDSILFSGLSSMEAVQAAMGHTLFQTIPTPIPILRIIRGWKCLSCSPRSPFLTTSLETVKRHASLEHGRKRGEIHTWSGCYLQTVFRETKHQRYYEVAREINDSSLDFSDSYIDGPACIALDSSGLYILEIWLTVDGTKDPVSTRGFMIPHRLSSIFPMDRQISTEHIQTLSNNSARSKEFSHSLPIANLPFSGGGIILSTTPTVRHHFTAIAARHIPFSTSFLDGICKSSAFRSATEPIVDCHHADSILKMQATFPDAEHEPSFVYAVMFSAVTLRNQGRESHESLLLHRRIIRLLNHKLTAHIVDLSAGDIGAIMILATTAYKTQNRSSYQAHVSGLAKIVPLFRHQMTPLARRSLFWIDLFASLFIASPQQFSANDVYGVQLQRPKWLRQELPISLVRVTQPPGFVRYQAYMTDTMTDCVLDIRELQAYCDKEIAGKLPLFIAAKYETLDNMQASIERRLANEVSQERQDLAISEAIRVTLFVCCFCSWMEIWNDSYVPCSMIKKLLTLLAQGESDGSTVVNRLTNKNLDLLFWMLYVSAAIIGMDCGLVADLVEMFQAVLMTSLRILGAQRPRSEHLSKFYLAAHHDFLYFRNIHMLADKTSSWLGYQKALLNLVSLDEQVSP